MKKYIFGAVLFTSILIAPVFTQAAGLTGEQIQSILSVISSFGVDQSTIDNVRTALNGGTPTGGGTPQPWCHTFNTNLTVGSSGDDVTYLNRAFVLSGFRITEADTSIFTEDTTTDVIDFQQKYGIRQTGYVGPRTRAKLNALYGCSPTTSNPITIITDSQLPNAKVGQPYSVAINTSDGSDSPYGYSWSVNNGAAGFPVTGLGISSTYGNPIYITGTPDKIYIAGVESTIANTFTFTVTVTSGSRTSSKQFTLTVDPATNTTPIPVTLTSISPASGPVGTSIRLDGCGSDSTSGFTLVYTGPKSGTAAIPVETLGAASGCGYMTITVPSDFPAGTYSLSVQNNQTGAMSTNSETFTVTAPAVSGGGAGSSAKCTTSFSPNSIKTGDIVTWNFAAGAGDTTFQYNCTGGGITKEDGTTLLSYGTLPLSGAWRIKVPGPLDCTLDSYNPNVTGSGSQCRASVAVTFFTITTASLPNASANASYSATLATTDVGTAPYQWSWSPAVSGSGVLPAGLTINPSTGVISGTPTAAGKYDVAVRVTNAAGTVATKNFTLYVDAQAGVSTKCTTSISKTGDIYTWNFKAGAGDTTFQYSCSSGFTKADGTTALGYGTLPLSGAWSITVPGYGYIDCTLDSYNPSVIGSGSQCRANSNGFVLGNSTSQALATTFTYVWNRDLQIGSPYSDDVTALQKALTLNGEYSGELTGGFYNQTYAAVKAFQQKYGIPATGYVGSLTRAQLNTLFAQ